VKARFVRLLLFVVLATAASSAIADPVSAAQVRRTWHATVAGSGGGSAALTLYPNNSGSITVKMAGLKKSTTYSQMIYKGSCAKPTALVKLSGLRTSTTGAASKTFSLTAYNGAAIWSVGPTGTVAYRIASGSWYRCATLRYEVATRISIPRYGINLPVIHQKDGQYPYCNVAMYLAALSQPGEAGPTMLYAHARTGMFLPLLTASKVNNGKAMIGMTVNVWTSDSKLYTYTVYSVVRHVDITRLPSNDFTSERLWIQTSEGAKGTRNKLFLLAKRVSVTTATYAAAHPTPRPVICH